MNRIHVLLALAVLFHIAWVATYETALGDLFGFVFVVLVFAALIPPAARALRRLRS